MAAVLADFLHRNLRREFKYGQYDCMLLLADWVHTVVGVDPAASLRSTYDQRSANRVIRSFGGMCAMIDQLLLPLNLPHTRSPQAGDIVVVNERRGMGAIAVGDGFYFSATIRGGLVRRAELINGWHVCRLQSPL